MRLPRTSRTKRPSTRRGVSPRKNAKLWFAVKKWLKYFTTVCVVSSLSYATYFYGGNAWRLFSEHPVENILVEGIFENVSQEQAMAMITQEVKDDFLQVDLHYLRGILERQPWIKKAVVARHWPNALIVKIEEQTPIARWGEVGFLNQSGEVIYANQNDNLMPLPWLFGAEQESPRIMRQYQDLSLILRSRDLLIDKLWLSPKNSWQITLKNGVDIALGKNNILLKMQRFMQIYDQYLAVNMNAIATIDLRYVNGLAVGWTDEYTVVLENAAG